MNNNLETVDGIYDAAVKTLGSNDHETLLELTASVELMFALSLDYDMDICHIRLRPDDKHSALITSPSSSKVFQLNIPEHVLGFIKEFSEGTDVVSFVTGPGVDNTFVLTHWHMYSFYVPNQTVVIPSRTTGHGESSNGTDQNESVQCPPATATFEGTDSTLDPFSEVMTIQQRDRSTYASLSRNLPVSWVGPCSELADYILEENCGRLECVENQSELTFTHRKGLDIYIAITGATTERLRMSTAGSSRAALWNTIYEFLDVRLNTYAPLYKVTNRSESRLDRYRVSPPSKPVVRDRKPPVKKTGLIKKLKTLLSNRK